MTEEKSTSQVVREGLERACKDFTERIEALGFTRTKRLQWTRHKPLQTDIIYFHRCGSTYGAPRNYSVTIRIHFDVQTPSDGSEISTLNGPFSDAGLTQAGRYHLRFNAKSGDTYDRCIDDLVRFVIEQGEPWFRQLHFP